MERLTHVGIVRALAGEGACAVCVLGTAGLQEIAWLHERVATVALVVCGDPVVYISVRAEHGVLLERILPI